MPRFDILRTLAGTLFGLGVFLALLILPALVVIYYYPDYWLFIVGTIPVLFIGGVLFMAGGEFIHLAVSIHDRLIDILEVLDEE